MRPTELLVIRHPDGGVELRRSRGPLSFGATLLWGPTALLGSVTHDSDDEDDDDDSVVVIDLARRRALADATCAPAGDGTLVDAERAIAAGVWACFGWSLGYADGLRATLPSRWPRAALLGRLQAGDAVALWHHLGSTPGPAATDVAHLSEQIAGRFAVRTLGGMPVLVHGDGPEPSSRDLCFAMGCAAAAGRYDPLHESLDDAPVEAWLHPPDLDWSLLAVDRDALVRDLAAINGESSKENLDNLRAVVEMELRKRRLATTDPWATLSGLPADDLRRIVTATAVSFREAGLLERAE